MTDAQMKDRIKEIENEMDSLKEEVLESESTFKAAMISLVGAALAYFAGIIVISFNLIAGLLIIGIAVLLWLLNRSYEKEAKEYVKDVEERSIQLAKEHLHLTVRSDPDEFIRSILERTIDS